VGEKYFGYNEMQAKYLMTFENYHKIHKESFNQHPAGAGNFSLHYRVQNGSGAHPASYPIGTRGSFPGGKAAEA
jgi:hypothetical protein